MNTTINVKITGQAGEGIKTTGLILSKIFTRSGFNIFSYDEYPSLIRGGHNCYQMYASTQKVHSQHKKLNILIALDKASVKLHQSELTKDSLILFDPDEFRVEETKGKLLPVPWAKIATDAGGSPIMSNMVALGAICGLTNLSLDPLFSLISDVFGKKGEKIVSANKKASQAGHDYVRKNFQARLEKTEPGSEYSGRKGKKEQKIVTTGNEMIGLGAIAAGLKYFSAYPMTPVSNLLHFLAKKAQDYSIIVNHPENEIAAINTAIGASAAGARTMTATSGGGFSLMVEGLGLTGMSETPLVILEGMRPGPSSGMPTWTGQADLLFMIYAGQDEFPRMVLTPGSINQCFYLTKKAFYFAEKYQMPVIILTDKYLLESHQSCHINTSEVEKNNRFSFCHSGTSAIESPTNANYLRYKITETGISPRPFLGQKGAACLTNSYEHGENGLATEETLPRKKQVEKRMQKLKTLKKELWPPKIFGSENAEVNLIGWGSTLGPVLEAIKQNPNINYLHLDYVWPFPKETVIKFLEKSKKPICIEGNASGQLAKLIAQETGIIVKNKLLKYDGRPFWPEEILEKTKNKI